jgi:signal transduction histidine kinase
LDELSVSGRQRTERFDLGTTIDDILEGHAVQFTRHRIVVRWRKPKAPLMVQAVKGMVIQIIENLISNSVYWIAIRQTREPSFEGRIAVEIRSDPLIVRFSDNGRGIAPDHRDRIFQPFWSLKEKGRRRGLGLYIARENAGYLGGNLTLSDARNEFDRLHEFVLELPLSAASK